MTNPKQVTVSRDRSRFGTIKHIEYGLHELHFEPMGRRVNEVWPQRFW